MSKQRASYGKRERDKLKKERADAKRERRHDRSPDEPDASEARPPASNDAILAAVAALHDRFERGDIDADSFAEERAELLSRLSIE